MDTGRPEVSSDYHVGLVLSFDSVEALRGYPTHPVHTEVLSRWQPKVASLRVFDVEDKKAVDARIAGGTKVTTMSGAPLEELKAKLDFVEKEWIAAANAKGIDGAAALAMLRAEAK